MIHNSFILGALWHGQEPLIRVWGSRQQYPRHRKDTVIVSSGALRRLTSFMKYFSDFSISRW
jgi:hypothetical protein